MIVFNKEIDFLFKYEENIGLWLGQLIENESYKEGEVNYIFCSDGDLLEKNQKFLNHDTLTDIISFDYTLGQLISGDIFISIDRVRDNSTLYDVSFEEELHRVMAHGVLHFCGYKDKTEKEKELMRSKEDYYLSLRQF